MIFFNRFYYIIKKKIKYKNTYFHISIKTIPIKKLS